MSLDPLHKRQAMNLRRKAELRSRNHRSRVKAISITLSYRLDGPGSNLGGDEIFRPFRPALGPTQPPVKWVPGLSQG